MGQAKQRGSLEEMTFEELVELATHRIHSALLEGGGKEMKSAIHMWMTQAITWRKGQNDTYLNKKL